MDKLKKLCKYLIKLDEVRLLNRAYKTAPIIGFIKHLNTREQLFMGVDATNTPLKSIGGDYSPLTKIIKARKGLPTNRVTLFDFGNFYSTIKAKGIGNGEAEITANYIKGGVDLRIRWGKQLIGLNVKSNEELIEKIKEYFITEIKNDISKI